VIPPKIVKVGRKMKQAYSNSKKKIVSINTEYNLNEVFCCPFSNCEAELKIKSAAGVKAKHFSRYSGSKQHMIGCPYSTFKSLADTTYDLQSFNLDNIFNLQEKGQSNNTTQNNKQQEHDVKDKTLTTITTPLKLLQYCLSNSMDTVLPNKETISDICVDSRNIGLSKYAKGFTGRKLIIGSTLKYDIIPEPYILLKIEKKFESGKSLFISAKVYLPIDLLQEINQYVFETFGEKYKGYGIAVLGDWNIDKDHEISCRLKSKKHIMFK
jgi:hypothetical protein